MENLLPQNDRETKMCSYWAEQASCHAKPSKDTKDFMDETKAFNKKMTEEIKKIEITQAEHGKDIAFIKEAIKESKDFMKETNENLKSFIDCADKKYAEKNELSDIKENAKLTRKYIDKVMWTSLATLIGMLGWLLKFGLEKLYDKIYG